MPDDREAVVINKMALEYRKMKAIENGIIQPKNNLPTKESTKIIKEAGKAEQKYQKNHMR